jgi:RecB family endonuclease NucS
MKKFRVVNRIQGLQKMRKIMDRYWKNVHYISEFSEQDLKTKFVVPMLQALNWDIYNFQQVREQKNFFGLLPDFILTDEHGKIVLVEVKPPLAYSELEKDIKKYRENSNVRKKAAVLLLTTFKDSKICTLGKVKGLRTIKISCSQYVSDFDRLWTYLSNSEEGFKTRNYEKALAPRG